MSINTYITMQNMVSPVLSSVVDSMNQVISSAEAVSRGTSDMIDPGSLELAKKSLADASAGISEMTAKQAEYNQEVAKGPGLLEGLKGKVVGLIGAYSVMRGMGKIIDMSDDLAQTDSMLQRVIADGESVAQTNNMIYAASQRARGSYTDMLDSASKMKLLTGDTFSSMGETVAFSELLNKSFKLGKTSIEAQNAAMHQLTQAMASGRLQGDEFVSIMENAPLLAQAIADTMGVGMGELKKLSSEGAITADIIKKAMFDSADKINEEFGKIPMTFEQIKQSAINNFVYQLQPHLQMLNDFMNSQTFQGFVSNFTNAMSIAVMVLGIALGVFVGGFNMVYSVIDAVKIPLMALIGIIGLYYGAVLAGLAIEKMKAFAMGISAFMTQVKATSLAQATAAQWGLNGAILASPIFWIPALIILIISLIAMVIQWTAQAEGQTVSTIGVVTGVIFSAISIVLNLFIGLFNNIITMVENTINGFVRFGEFIANFAKHPLQASLRLFMGFADQVLNILSSVASTIDSIFGSNLASILTGFQANANAWVDSQLSSDYEKFEDVKLKRIEPVGNIAESYKKGYEWGSNKEKQIKDKLNIDTSLGEQTQMAKEIADKAAQGLGGKDVGNNVKNIADSTKGIDKKLDNIDWKNNNLDGLKGLMETRAINDLSKEIKLEIYQEFSGNISSDVDVEDVANRASEKILHEFDIAVHAG